MTRASSGASTSSSGAAPRTRCRGSGASPAPQIPEVEPHARGAAALHSPETGIVDFGAVARSLASGLEKGGTPVVTDCPVSGSAQRHQRVVLTHDEGRDRRPLRRVLRGQRLRPSGRGLRGLARPPHRALPRGLPVPQAGQARSGHGHDLSGAGPLAPLPGRAPHQPHRRPGLARAQRSALATGHPRAHLAGHVAHGRALVAHRTDRDPSRRQPARVSPPRRPTTFQRFGPTTSRRASPACALRRWPATAAWSTTSCSRRPSAPLHVRNAPSPAATSSLALAALIADKVDTLAPA